MTTFETVPASGSVYDPPAAGTLIDKVMFESVLAETHTAYKEVFVLGV